MNILDLHSEKLKSPNVSYHRFLQKYGAVDNQIYLFCEGTEDVGYYSQAFRMFYPQYKIVKFYPGCKDNVIAVYNIFDWERFPRNRILFFVDRDMSYWRGEPQFLAENIYITDGYSFENDLVSENNFISFLEDLFGFAQASQEEIEVIKNLYRQKWQIFVDNSYYIMAAVKVAGDVGKRTAKNIAAGKIISINQPQIWRSEYNQMPIKDYILQALELDDSYNEAIYRQIKTFLNDLEHYCVRGKWALVFMVKLLIDVRDKREKIAPTTIPRGNESVRNLLNLDYNNAATVLGNRIRPNESLLVFLRKNLEVE